MDNTRKSYSTTEYAAAFRNWMQQQQYMQQMSWFSYQMSVYYSYLPLMAQSFTKMPVQPPQSATHATHAPLSNAQAASQERGIICIISPPWKRYIAEIIDFCFLFVIKMTIALFIFDFLDMPEIDEFIDSILDNGIHIRIPFEMIYVEIINKLFICFFEAVCLSRGVGNQVGGQTPGKRIMRVKVVTCLRVIQVDNVSVLVYPAKDLGFLRALVRSFIKNTLLLVPPLVATTLFLPHYRAFYDTVAKTVVVDADPPRE